jgi:hypothetical protein
MKVSDLGPTALKNIAELLRVYSVEVGKPAAVPKPTRRPPPNTKGVWEEIAKGAVEPLLTAISGDVGALWTRQAEKDKLEIETKKTQLEAAKWPKFSDIAAQ